MQECDFPEPAVHNAALEHIMRELAVAVSCALHTLGCEFSATLEKAIEHEQVGISLPGQRLICTIRIWAMC